MRNDAIFFPLLTFIAAWAVSPEHVSGPFIARPNPFSIKLQQMLRLNRDVVARP
jgi:hypothetical protein